MAHTAHSMHMCVCMGGHGGALKDMGRHATLYIMQARCQSLKATVERMHQITRKQAVLMVGSPVKQRSPATKADVVAVTITGAGGHPNEGAPQSRPRPLAAPKVRGVDVWMRPSGNPAACAAVLYRSGGGSAAVRWIVCEVVRGGEMEGDVSSAS